MPFLLRRGDDYEDEGDFECGKMPLGGTIYKDTEDTTKDLKHCGWLKDDPQDYELSFPVDKMIENGLKVREMLPWMEHNCFNG